MVSRRRVQWPAIGTGTCTVGSFASIWLVKPHLRRFAFVVEFLAQAFAEFLVDLLVLDGVVHAVIDRHRQAQLAEVGIDRTRHVGILQLAGDVGAVVQARAMHLTETGRGGGFVAEAGELRLPVGAEFACHATAHEIPAHRRGVGLELREFRGVFGGKRVGHGGQELRHLHQRTLQAAQDGAQVLGVRGAVGLDAEHALARNARGDTAHGAGGPRHAAEFAEQIAAVRHGESGRAVQE